MIRQLLLPAIALLVLASCSNKMSLVKRKYNKGFYVSVTKKNNAGQAEKEIASNKTVRINPAPEENKSEATVTKAETVAPLELVTKSVIAEAQATKDEINHTMLTASADKNEKIVHLPAIKSLKTKELMKISQKGKGASDDKIIQVILALFPILCLIAIYLHDGKSITLNFWIDLILHITFIGEIIFALLVVLDIINLA